MIPEDVRRLILTSIPSVPHLEALLLLRAERNTTWGTALTARRLYISEKIAEQVLADLAEAGFIQPDSANPPGYRYAPGSTEQAEAVERLAIAYAHDLVEVTNLIHAKSAQLFADAFRFRRDS